MQEHLTDKEGIILDIGCGTGLTANELYKAGYTNLHGIDLSADMVEIARERGIYRGLVAGDVNQPLDYKTKSFDGVISSGTFTHGHVGPEPLTEIFRIMKPGGILACTIHQDLWQQRHFDLAFQELEKQDQARCLSRKFGSYYVDHEPEGYFCVYRKTPD
jgi:predicted TPR repeat methyltransferase